jgi:hypothetical protein
MNFFPSVNYLTHLDRILALFCRAWPVEPTIWEMSDQDSSDPGGSEMVDDAKLYQFMGQMLSDLGGAASVALVRIGDALGFYKALRERGPMTVGELAAAAGVNERYLREWLSHQAASNYLSYAREHWVTANTGFAVATAKGNPERAFDLVAFFDCLHDMGDPAGAAAHVRQSLKPDGARILIGSPAAPSSQCSSLWTGKSTRSWALPPSRNSFGTGKSAASSSTARSTAPIRTTSAAC